MEETKRFHVFMKRNHFANIHIETYMIGIVQGLIYGMCSIPCDTTMWDCERFERFVLFTVDCTNERCEEFIKIAESKWPGLCHYEEVEES